MASRKKQNHAPLATFDDLDVAGIGAGYQAAFTAPQETAAQPEPEERGLIGVAKDSGISLLKGAISVPEAAVGVADLVTGGRAGKAAEAIGFRPREAKAMLDEGYSEQQKEAFRRVQAAQGFGDTFTEAVRNPSVVGHAVLESLPLMGAGGVVARSGMALAPRLAPVAAGAIGEGTVSAGSAAEAIRQQTADGTLDAKQSLLAGGTGVLTAGFAALGGKIAKSLGIADVDTMLAGAAANPASAKSLTRRVLEGAAAEGILEELPQSVQEQVLQNAALGKPLDEGVNQAAVLGMLSGSVMGGGANVIASGAPVAEPTPEPKGPLSRAANATPVAATMGIEPAVTPGPQEPALDPVVERIKQLQGADREEALAAYNILNREDSPKGVRQYNSRLLDQLLAKLEPAEEEAAPVESSDPADLLASGMDRDPVQGALSRQREEETALQNLENWMARAQPLALDHAQDLQAAAAERGFDMAVVPHSDGQGYTVVPSQWITPEMRGQVAAALPMDTTPTGVLRADAAGNVALETSAQAIDTRQAQAVQQAEAQRKAELGLTPDIEAMQAGKKHPPKPTALPGDVVNKQGEPFKNKGAALRAQKKAGGELLEVQGGWVVRTAQPELEVTDVGSADATGAVAAGDGEQRGADGGAGGRDSDPAGVDAGGELVHAAAAPAAGGAEGEPVRNAGSEPAAAVANAAASPALASAPAADATPPLDHGELNIPGRTNTIDAELDRYKATQQKAAKVLSKEKATERRANKVQAKQLLSELWPAMKEKMADRFGEKELRNTLDSMVKWEPARFIALAEKFRKEQEAAPASQQEEGSAAVTPRAEKEAGQGETRTPAGADAAGAAETGAPARAAADVETTRVDDTAEAGQFRRTEVSEAVAAAAGKRTAAIQEFVDGITAKWSNAPDVVVVANMQDPKVPEKVRETDAAQRDQGSEGQVHGFHYQGKVYLVAEALDGPETALTTLAHEALGHYGLQGFFGEALKPIKQQIVAMRKKEVLAKAEAYGMPVTPEAVREELGPGATDADVKKVISMRLLYAAEEVLAEMAQTTPQLGFVRRAIAAIRTFLRDTLGLKLELTDDEIIRNFILPARGWVVRGEGTGAKRTSREVNFSKAPATDSAAFKKWFGDSKVVDEHGRPLVVYHGTAAAFSEFRPSAGWYGEGIYFAPSPESASDYAAMKAGNKDDQSGANVVPVYLALQNPYVFRVKAGRQSNEQLLRDLGFSPRQIAKAEREWNSLGDFARDHIENNLGHDGLVVIDEFDGNEYVAFYPDQIKSAIGNRGTFDPKDPNVNFSRGAAGNTLATTRPLRAQIMEAMNDTFTAPGKLNWWHKTVGTQYNLAQRSPQFKRVFDAVQDFLNDVSLYATEAADLAPKILPKLETWRDIGKAPISAEDNKAVSAPIFEGTLLWARDERGRPVKVEELRAQASDLSAEAKAQRMLRAGAISENVLKMWKGLPLEQYEAAVNTRFESQMLRPGVVWTDEELRSQFSLSAGQIGLYREFRGAVGRSLTQLAISDMVRFGGKDVDAVRQEALDSPDVDAAALILRDELLKAADEQPDRNELLIDTAERMMDKADRARDLMDRGYAPLSRFGHYTVDVIDESGERVYFGMFETAREAALMARKMRGNFPKAQITRGTVSEEEYKLFAGVSPETVELFGELLGLEAQGDDAASKAFQTYIKVAKANRSAMKRLIERKGIAGFSEDVGRVLAGFVYSNARQTSQNLHMGEMTDSAAAVSKGEGELKDAATRLVDYIKNPQEEAQAFRGLLFAQYLGGSVASAFVNMLQPVQVTFPYLSQFGGAAKAAGRMKQAMADVKKKTTGDAALDAALKKAEEEGIVAPQEVHQLMAQARGRGVLKSGDGTATGNAQARASNALSRLALAWGKFFGLAEQFNRRVTFIAAYRTAAEQGMADPAGFAEKAIAETQFIYNKGNKPQWARGAIGSTIFTFKQYSISYVELLHRMAAQGGPEGKKAALLMLGMLLLMSGAGGLPFAEDLENVVDGVMQRMGHNFSSKLAKKQFFEKLLGKELGRFAEHGLSGLPGVPIDVSGRLGMGNLIPGTGLLVDKDDHTRDVTEVAGAAGDFATRLFKGANKTLQGDVVGAAKDVFPRAAVNAFKGAEMATTGIYKDDRGRKVIDVDGFDAAMKALGFQPTDVAKVQEATGLQQQLIAGVKQAEARFADRWAKAVAEGNQAELANVREDIRAYNAKNPDTRVSINRSQIATRVKALREDKATRIQRTAPKEIRATVRRELEPA
jgi:hypothetical protein